MPNRKPQAKASPAPEQPEEAAPSAPDGAEESASPSRPARAPKAQPLFERTTLGQILVGLAGLFILTYLGVALARIRYPFGLEWIEGGLFDEVRWILDGHKPYVPPSLDYVPFLYNPLFFWVSALSVRVFGPSLFALRLVSFSASLGTMALLGLLVHRETGSRAAGVVGAGLFAATFKMTEQFMDLARVDSLFVFFAILSLFLLRARPTPIGRAAAGLSLVLCFLTKQSGAMLAMPIVLWVLYEGWRGGGEGWRARLGGAPLALIVGIGIGGSVIALDAWTDGWYRFYAIEIPSQHRLVPWLWTDFWSVDLMAPFGCACVGAAFVLIEGAGMSGSVRGLWGSALAGALLASWSGRLHDGGWNNVIMPAFALLSALLAIALWRGFTLAARLKDRAQRGRVQAFILLVGIGQLAMRIYDPRAVVPKEADERAGREVVATLASAPGDVFVPTDSYLAGMAGKRRHLHQMAVDDLARAGSNPTTEGLLSDIRNAFAGHRWSMVITDNDWFATEVIANYQRGKPSVQSPDAFFPMSGVHYRPGWVFTPK